MHNRSGQQPSRTFKIIAVERARQIVDGAADVSAQITIEEADRLSKTLKDADLKAAQIRLVFSKVRQIEARWASADEQDATSLREILLLKPRLKYQSQRIPAMGDLSETMIVLIDLVKNRKQFQRFVDFFEAVVAYHKVYGGRD